MEEDIYYKGYKIKIRPDEDSESPDDWRDDNLFLVYDHRQFYVERAGFAPQSIYHYLYAKNIVESGDDVDSNYKEELESYYEYGNFHIFLVEAYIHSGVSLSLFSGTKQCRWDSSISRYILASKEEFESEEVAKNAAEGLIETWNQYLCRDVWRFIIEKPNTTYSISKDDLEKILDENNYIDKDEFYNIAMEDQDWEEVDSCWGFYGEDAAIDEAKAVINNLTKE